jgi:uncharacterized protein (DUF779 family)
MVFWDVAWCCNPDSFSEICKWEDNIKVEIREIMWGDIDWINLAVDRDQWQALMNVVMNLWVP